MKKYNISKPEKYISNGVEKTFWATVGTMTEFSKDDGSVSRIIEIPAIGLKANVFEQTQRVAPAQPATYAGLTTASPVPKSPATMNEPPVEYPAENINPEDIPF